MNEPLDPPESNDLRIEDRTEEVVQSMLELERALVKRGMHTDEYQLDDDVCLRIYEDHGQKIVKLLMLMLQSIYLENQRMRGAALVEVAEIYTELQILAHKKLLDVCEKIAIMGIDK